MIVHHYGSNAALRVPLQPLLITPLNSQSTCLQRVCKLSLAAASAAARCRYDHMQIGNTVNWWTVVNDNVWESTTLAMIRHVLKSRCVHHCKSPCSMHSRQSAPPVLRWGEPFLRQ